MRALPCFGRALAASLAIGGRGRVKGRLHVRRLARSGLTQNENAVVNRPPTLGAISMVPHLDLQQLDTLLKDC
jgi:hypothetical protein